MIFILQILLIYIDDEGIMIGRGLEVETLYRERGMGYQTDRGLEGRIRESIVSKNIQVIKNHGTSYTRDRICIKSRKML